MTENIYIKNLLGAFATNLSHQIEQQISSLSKRGLSHEITLVSIYNHPGESIDTLKKVLNLSHSGTVKLINTLESEGLVVRTKSTTDARVMELNITELGKQHAQEILVAREDILTQTISSLQPEQIELLTPILESMMKNMTTDTASARRICKICDEKSCKKRGCPVESSIES